MIHLFTTNLQAQVLKLLPIVTFFFFGTFRLDFGGLVIEIWEVHHRKLLTQGY